MDVNGKKISKQKCLNSPPCHKNEPLLDLTAQ